MILNNFFAKMKLFSISFAKAKASALILSGVMALTSCSNPVFDYEGDCDPHYYVEYVYDMNMEWANAFSSQVNSVELYIFDSTTGELVDTYKESDVSKLSAPGYRMPIYVNPGDYEFVAWCGLENNMENLFSLDLNVSHREHLNCRMHRQYDDSKAYQNKQLHGLFHGKVSASLPDREGEHIVTVNLIKDTNNINLSMQHLSGKPLTIDMFSVTMSEGNGYLAHDNTIKSDEDIEFRPWHLRSGMVDIGGRTKDSGDENLNYFMAELSTSRLMADRDPRVNIIDNATGKIVYSIPIVQWATTFRSQQYKDSNNNIHVISDNQEYLDRESDYDVMLYLDNGEEGWVAASIYINSWKVVLQGADIY